MNNNLNKMYSKNDELYTPRVLVEPMGKEWAKQKTPRLNHMVGLFKGTFKLITVAAKFRD